MYNLNYKPLFFLIIIGFSCVFGCTSKKTESIDLLNPYSLPFIQKNLRDTLIKYDYVDVNPYVSSGLVWVPFVLPQKKDEIIKESDLLLGYWNEANDPILPPERGSCRLIKDLDVDSTLKTSLRLVNFVSGNVDPKRDADALMFLLNPIDQSPFAIVRLNNEGRASCFVSLKAFNISIGYGQFRKEIQVTDSIVSVKVPFPETSYLNVDPSIGRVGFLVGDTLRIGRNIVETNNTILKNIETNGQYAIPAKIQKDLYISGNFTTKNMGVDEYIATSFLIGKRPFKVVLEPGNYTVAILRKNKLICLKKITFTGKEINNLSCSEIMFDEIDFEDTSKNYYFDTTLFPLHIIESAGFQDWVFASKKYFLLTSPNYYQDNFYKKEESGLKEFSFVYYSPSEKINNYLPNTYRAIRAMDIEKAQFRQIYEGLNANNISSTMEFLRSNPKNLLFFGIPVGGSGEQGIVNYAVPFFNYTKISLGKASQDFLKYANIQATNGVYINLFEPLPNPADESLLISYAQQRFRFRITIPPWNSTNIVEMYVNGKLFRRWILDRGDISKIYSKSFEESFSETKSFVVRWVAWGEEFLPDFLSGTKNSLPFSITRDYCIDNNGDGECHMEQKNG